MPNGDTQASWPLWARLLDRLGVPIFLVLFGLGAWTGWIPSPLTDAARAVLVHAEHDDERDFALFVLCLRASRTDAEQEECGQIMRRGRICAALGREHPP